MGVVSLLGGEILLLLLAQAKGHKLLLLAEGLQLLAGDTRVMDLPIPICRQSGLSWVCAVGNAVFHGLALRLRLLQHSHGIAGSGLNACVRPGISALDALLSLVVGKETQPEEETMADQRHLESGSCERRTCLKWQPSGELSEHDFANLMELLLVADQELHADDHCDLQSA